jgi:hypothetical protein
MPIRPFLSVQAFDPETIDKMSEALKSVCDTLSLNAVDVAQRSSLLGTSSSLRNVRCAMLLGFKQ